MTEMALAALRSQSLVSLVGGSTGQPKENGICLRWQGPGRNSHNPQLPNSTMPDVSGPQAVIIVSAGMAMHGNVLLGVPGPRH